MSTAIKRRRGTTAQHATFTGLEAELTVDTDKKTVVVHDNATAGGFPLARADQVLKPGEPVPSSSFLPGQIIQEVVATRNVDDASTSTTFVDTGLSATISPLLDDSVLEVIAIVPIAQVARVAGSETSRSGVFRIRNSTDAVAGLEYWFGRSLAGASSDSSFSRSPVWCHHRYTVNSLASRTFVLQFRVPIETNIQVSTLASASEITMIIREIRQ